MSDWDALVVGAGPAGSAAATVLASSGHRVLLVEKDRFPRAKVCGEFLASAALADLERLGAREAVEASKPERITAGSLHLSDGRGIPFSLPSPALGVSRWTLDTVLAARAAEAGANVRFETRVREMTRESGGTFSARLSFAGADEDVRARVVVGAWGRWDALDRALDRGFLRRSRFFGWSRDYSGNTAGLAGTVRLYLFLGGYCGLSRVEGGEANLAGVVAETAWKRAGSSWDGVLEAARASNQALDRDLHAMTPGHRGFLGTVPVVFTAKPPVEDGILMAGDAAGVLDPFSGQGQAAALASGVLAGDTASEFLDGRLAGSDYARVYERAWRLRFRRGFAWGAAMRTLMLAPRLGRFAAAVAGGRLVRLGIRKLAV